MYTATYWIDHLDLQPHPEGGFFKEVYRAAEHISGDSLPDRYQGPRAMSTGIYFLLTGDTFSAFHRILSDEGWHFYAGTAVSVYVIDPGGGLTTHILGPGEPDGFQVVIPHQHWFAARVIDPEGYALLGCTVAPGFDFQDFELARAQALAAKYPEHESLIRALTRQ